MFLFCDIFDFAKMDAVRDCDVEAESDIVQVHA